jgi:hypothetical protein
MNSPVVAPFQCGNRFSWPSFEVDCVCDAGIGRVATTPVVFLGPVQRRWQWRAALCPGGIRIMIILLATAVPTNHSHRSSCEQGGGLHMSLVSVFSHDTYYGRRVPSGTNDRSFGWKLDSVGVPSPRGRLAAQLHLAINACAADL